MITVNIDGHPVITDTSSIKSMADLVEVIKANIDPDTIITELRLQGRELTEADWRVPLSVQGDSTLEVLTGTKEEFVLARLEIAVDYIGQIAENFSTTGQLYKDGKIDDANMALGRSVNDLQAFLGWYATVLEILPPSAEQWKQQYGSQLTDLAQTCEQLVQQQLYQSWWALGETISGKLDGRLNALKALVEQLSHEVSQAQ